MSNTIDTAEIRNRYNRVASENERRKAVLESTQKNLQDQYGTSDLAELEAMYKELQEDFEKDKAAYDKAYNDIHEYVRQKEEELNG